MMHIRPSPSGFYDETTRPMLGTDERRVRNVLILVLPQNSLGDGQMNGKSGTFARRAFDCNRAAVDLGDVLDNRQAQARAAELSAPPFIHNVETFKNAREVFSVYAAAVVLHGDGNLRVRLFG